MVKLVNLEIITPSFTDHMGLLDGSNSKKIDYLEEERIKLWNRLTANEKFTKELERQIQSVTGAERDTYQASKKASEFRNRTSDRLNEATEFVKQIKIELEVAESIKNQIRQAKIDVDEEEQSIQENSSKIETLERSYEEKFKSLDDKIKAIEQFTEDYPDLEEGISSIEKFVKKIEDNSDKSSISLSFVNKRRKEIDEIHREIFGYFDSNNDLEDDSNKVPGLKDELDKSYDQLSEDLSNSLDGLEKLKNEYSNKYSDFENEHKNKYKGIVDEIRGLLPNALTAGLSSAFSTKKNEEVEASLTLQKNFDRGIYFMMGVSAIPLIVSVVFIVQGVGLEEVILRLPRLVLAIIPMYIPVLWLTYSANKKLNLSKRLIEEYAHKEVISKTYEGLSTQISNISDSGISEELRIRLLTNLLQISSENPGKLISNYEASDHPIMEALEQSYKFQIAIDKLEGIPGLGKVAAILESSAKKKLKSREEKIETALNSDTSLEDTD